MKTIVEFLREKNILGPENTKWLMRFDDGREIDLVELIAEYGCVITDYIDKKLDEQNEKR